MGARPPRLDGDEIALAVSKLSREPFQEVLTLLIEAAPDREDVHAFAKRYPDRWAQAVTILARLGGYHDKVQIDATVTLDVARMSDAQLLQRLGETEEGLAALQTAPEKRLLLMACKNVVPTVRTTKKPGPKNVSAKPHKRSKPSKKC